jgi:hypothetical protein
MPQLLIQHLQLALQQLDIASILAALVRATPLVELAFNYNSRTQPLEILVSGAQWRTVRARETFEDLVRGEQP